MKTNFKPNMETVQENKKPDEITEEEFEKYVSKNGAAGSFMIFRSHKKEDEMGLDEL